MSLAQFCVSWDSYKDSISKGFSRLQQNGEFVDMTLAAEGHLVKVHQNVVALASPYLKAMIQSASCQHPVVFLNNINHEILGFILEYIYTGEVKIPTDMLAVFIEASKALCITGVENFVLPKKTAAPPLPEQPEPPIERTLEPSDNCFAAHITINSENYNVEVNVEPTDNTQDTKCLNIPLENVDMHYEPQSYAVISDIETPYTVLQNNIEQDKIHNISDQIIYQPSQPIISVDNMKMDIEPPSLRIDKYANIEQYQSNILTNSHANNTITNTTDKSIQNVLNLSMKNMNTRAHKKIETILPSTGDKAQHYTISNRGSLQLLLNRYMYYCHHSSSGGRKRRWRCVDYRKLHCSAYVDTEDDNIINKSEVHSHAYHDNKIQKKIRSKSIFTSLSLAEEKIINFKKHPPRVFNVKQKQKPFDDL